MAKCRHLKKLTYKGLCGRCLSEFIDWKYSQSCWYFRPSFVNCSPLTFSLVQLSPPPSPLPSVNSYTVYTYSIQCVRGGCYGVLGQRNTSRKVPLQVNFFRWRHFPLPSMSFIFLCCKYCREQRQMRLKRVAL